MFPKSLVGIYLVYLFQTRNRETILTEVVMEKPLNRMTATSASTSYDPTEIVPLMTKYYELLARMRYFPSSSIKYPPHFPVINVQLATSLGIEPQVISLLEQLPYAEGYGSEDEFIFGGSFADFRQDRILKRSRTKVSRILTQEKDEMRKTGLMCGHGCWC